MKLKKVLAVATAVVTMAALSLTSFAATGVSAQEQKILDMLSKTVTTQSGAKLTIPSEYLAQAKTYLAQSDVDLDADTVADALAQIEEAIEVVEASDAKTFNDLSKADKEAILAAADSVAADLDLTLTYNSTTKAITIKDADGNVVFKTGNIIKKTGAEAYAPIAMASVAAVVVLAGSVVVLKKKGSENA